MLTSDLDYELPEALIAQHPAQQRDEARLLVVRRDTGEVALDRFGNLAQYLDPGDCLVLNDTRVIRARLHATKPTGGRVEVFLLAERAPGEWEALVRPSARVRPGARLRLAADLSLRVEERLPEGKRRVVFDAPGVLALLERAGEIPLPPYIHRDAPDASDLTRYQTIYAEKPGAVAAPTAGLHYTEAVLTSLRARAVGLAFLTLHVGYGTFKPIQAERLEDHRLDPESFTFCEASARLLNETRAGGGRIVAVGSTCTRVLETCYRQSAYAPGSGETAHYIFPPYTFQAVDALQTNFHLPRSSLLALVYAFGGVDLMRRAYARAIAERMRFYSYGDTMLIL